ncbi:DUF397 domain-containing protein [Actinoplanes sp. CA-252034]|uniref:DUF397 domain-containing protein n=1 Tax=Actinoplanes sp. CA-252034 TaxID=3239906 RepID=UPI003D952E07
MEDTTTAWRRSTFCASGSCVEIAHVDGTIRLRDGKNPELPPVVFTLREWTGFQERVLAIGKSS